MLTLALSGAVTVAGGVPSLALSNGAAAVYDAAHSTATSLAFDYTVQGGQSSSSLAVTGVNLNGATATDVAGNAANFAGATSTFRTLTVNASPTSVTTLNANGTIHDIHYYGIAGQASDYDVVYGTNNKPAEALYSNGMTDTYTYNSNGALHEQDYQGVTGQKYTSTDTVYGANSAPASEVLMNGSTVVQTETWNANGTINDIHYYGVTGQAYTDYDVVYGANNKAASATFSNGMTETLTYNSANTLLKVIYQGITGRNTLRPTRSTAPTTRRRARCGQTARRWSRPKPGMPTARSPMCTSMASPAKPTPTTTSSMAPTTSRRRRSTPTA